MQITITIVAFILLATHASYGFIPPVPVMLKDMYSERKTGATFEVTLTHQVKLAVDGDPILIQEKIIREKNRTIHFWKLVSEDKTIPAIWNGKEYRLPDGPNFPSDTKLFMRIFLSTSAEELQNALLNERFLKKSQLTIYKTGYSFDGDPNLWNMRDNYQVHPDISVKRTPQGPAYAINGYAEGKNSRTFYVDRLVKGIQRLEWETESGITAWNFSSHGPQALGGLLPKKFTFESGGITLVESRLSGTRVLTADQIKDTKKAFAQLMKDEP